MKSQLEPLYRELMQILSPILDHKGEVLYSPAAALRPNDIYLLGYNPGQGGPDTSVAQHLEYSLGRTNNAWLDEHWRGDRPSPLQVRMRKLFDEAGFDLKTTPSSNLIFATSNDASGVDYKLALVCWAAHQAILQIVQPRKLIVFGNDDSRSPYAFILARYGGQEERWKYAPRRTLKRFTTTLDGRETTVIGLMHPSRFVPPPVALEWIREG